MSLISPPDIDRLIDSRPTGRQTLKVLHVVNGEHYAGAARVQDLLAMSLPKFGYEVSFACVYPEKFESQRQSVDSPLFNFPMATRLDFRPAKKVAQLMESGGYHLLHSHTTRSAMIASTAAKTTGLPYLHHVHCQMNTEVGLGIKARVNMGIERMACNRADRTIAVSGSIERFLQTNGFKTSPISVVPNGVPAAAAQKPARDQGQPWTIGMVALLRQRKGLETLLHALPRLRQQTNVRLRIVGSFESTDYGIHMLALASKLGIEDYVDWTGFTRDVNSELVQMDVVVLPSVLPEGMPMVLLEAMSAGVPIAGSDVDGITDVIRHEHNGVLFDPGNVESLTTQLMRIVSGELSWDALRQECLTDYEHSFSDHAMAASMARVYDEILGQSAFNAEN